VVVSLHGCDGLRPFQQTWADDLSQEPRGSRQRRQEAPKGGGAVTDAFTFLAAARQCRLAARACPDLSDTRPAPTKRTGGLLSLETAARTVNGFDGQAIIEPQAVSADLPGMWSGLIWSGPNQLLGLPGAPSLIDLRSQGRSSARRFRRMCR
jgi:hypothetical protein